MPTYVYRREDGSSFEIQQRITEDALSTCPETGQSVVRVISANTGLIFKGSGFYLTDYARNGNGSTSGSSEASAPTGESSSTESKEAKPSTSTKEAA